MTDTVFWLKHPFFINGQSQKFFENPPTDPKCISQSSDEN